MGRSFHQKLPPAGQAREALREKGQFWTPQWVAEAMIAYVVGGGASHVFDPAVGAGAFFQAAKSIASEEGRKITLLGTEIDADSLKQALEGGLFSEDLRYVEIRDFVTQPPTGPFDAVIANPPYIRHHRLADDLKGFLRYFGASILGRPLDGRAGYHVYFFLRGLQSLAKGGRLAFIMPADVCEGVFAHTLWHWILSNYRLDAVITFAPEATPFPAVDTNALVFMLRNEKPTETFIWAKCLKPETPALRRWVESEYKRTPPEIHAWTRFIKEALATGLSRPPLQRGHIGPLLGDFATVLRGIATGANDFFFLTKKCAGQLNIPAEWLIPAIGRTRDVQGDIITPETLRKVEASGRPTLLLSLDATPIEIFPEPLRRYLRYGKELGIDKRPLVSTRTPWYKMEARPIPPFLFAYLGRRNARFIRNLAGLIPLTCFLCVYPVRADAKFIEQLWNVLRDPETVSNLALVGKSYGGGAIKVEPRALERLPMPKSALDRWGLDWHRSAEQLELAAG